MSENSATPETASPTPPPPAGQPYGANQPYVVKRVKKRKGVRVWVVVLLVILGVLVGTLVQGITSAPIRISHSRIPLA